MGDLRVFGLDVAKQGFSVIQVQMGLFVRPDLVPVIEDQPIVLYGDGEQSRDFTFVEDVAGLIWKAANAAAAPGNMYNAGNGGCYSLNLVWDTLQKIEGVTLPAKYGPPRAGDVRDSMADTTLAVRDLGHAPQFTLEEGLRRTLAWYRSALS